MIRMQIATGYLLLGAGLVLLLANNEIDEILFQEMFRSRYRYALPLAFVLMLYGAALLMLQYLRGNLFATTESAKQANLPEAVSTAAIGVLREKVSDLASELQSLKSAQLGIVAGDRNQFIEALKPTLHADLTEALAKRFATEALLAARDAEIQFAFSSAQKRLIGELSSLSRRSNLNLVIGVVTTALAVGLLTYMVLGSTLNLDSLTSILSHYLPRLTLVIFIEVFSFFFLRLYRATLAEMRTYQTDLTMLTIQEVAVLAALTSSSSDAGTEIAKELLQRVNPQTESKHSKEVAPDPQTIAEVLKQLTKAVLPKDKGG
jgi:hypothetical protein